MPPSEREHSDKGSKVADQDGIYLAGRCRTGGTEGTNEGQGAEQRQKRQASALNEGDQFSGPIGPGHLVVVHVDRLPNHLDIVNI